MIRTAWVILVTLVLTPFYGSVVIVWRLLRLPGMARICRFCPSRWARAIVRASGVRVEMEGLEHLRGRPGQILVANHASWYDVLVLAGYLPVDYRFVAKKELARIPFFGGAWQACGHIAIDREDRTSAIQSLAVARRQVNEVGESPTVVIFPEGTRTPDGALHAFKKGAFVLAIQAGVPVVPAAILGSRAVMAKGSWRIRSGTVRVRFGEAIPVDGMVHADRNDLTRAAREAVAALRGGEGVREGVGGEPSEAASSDAPTRG